MSKIDDLLDKRKAEIDADEAARRRDKDNYNSAIGSGILGALIGGLISGVVGFIVTAVSGLIYSIFLGSIDESATWPAIIFFGIVIVGVLLGYISGFSSKRQSKDSTYY